MLKPTLVRSSPACSVESVANAVSTARPVWPRISLVVNALLLLAVTAMTLGKAHNPLVQPTAQAPPSQPSTLSPLDQSHALKRRLERAAHQRSPPKSESHARNVDKLGIDLPSPDWTNGGRASLGGSTFGLAKTRNMASWRARVAEYQQNRSTICSGSSDCEAFDAIEHYFWGMEGGISLELGGLDGVFSSETLMLEKLLNFKRIVVDANPAMRKRRQDQAPQVLGANIAVCGTRGKVHYLQGPSPEGLVNGIAEFMPQEFLRRYYPQLAQAYAKIQSWDAVRTVRKEFMRIITKVECMPLSHFFRIFRIARIDFMILDVEGAELSVLRTIDWSAVTVNVLVIESIALSRPAEYRHEVDRYILNASNTYPRTFTKVFDARGRNCWYRDKTFSPSAVIASNKLGID